MPSASNPSTPDVFISYSRRNKDFVLQLVEALNDAEREVWIDLEAIPPSAEWWAEIKRGIDEAHTFVPILTPELLSSPVCTFEMAYAVKNKKRIIPIMHTEAIKAQTFGNIAAIDPDGFLAEILGDDDLLTLARNNWRVIEKLNWIMMREGDDFEVAFTKFLHAIEVNLENVRLHSRLLVQAHDWTLHEYDRSYLLTGNELQQAVNWLALYGEQEPEATDVQRVFIQASVEKEAADEAERQRFIRRAKRNRSIAIAVGIVAVLVAIGAAIFTRENISGVQLQAEGTLRPIPVTLTAAGGPLATIHAEETQVAQNQRLARARELTGMAREKIQAGDIQSALRLVLDAIPLYPYEPDEAAFTTLMESLEYPLQERFFLPNAGTVQWIHDTDSVLSINNDKVYIWRASSQYASPIVLQHDNSVSGVWVDEEEGRFVSWTEDAGYIWDFVGNPNPRVAVRFIRNTDDLLNLPLARSSDFVYSRNFGLQPLKPEDCTIWQNVQQTDNCGITYDDPSSIIWSLIDEQVYTLRLPFPDALAFSPTRTYFFAYPLFSPTTFASLNLSLSDTPASIWSINGSNIQYVAHVPFEGDLGTEVKWSSDGELIAVASGNNLLVYNLGGELVFSGTHFDRINDLEWNRDNTRVLTWADDYLAVVWNIDRSAPTITLLHNDEVRGARWSQDEQSILTWSSDDTVRVWDLDDINNVRTLTLDGTPDDAIWSQDNRQVLTYNDNTAWLWNPSSDTTKELSVSDPIRGAQWRSDEQYILLWGGNNLYLWSPNNEATVVAQHTSLVAGASWSADGHTILSWTGEGDAHIWTIDFDADLRGLSRTELLEAGQNRIIRNPNNSQLEELGLPTLFPTVTQSAIATILLPTLTPTILLPSVTPFPQLTVTVRSVEEYRASARSAISRGDYEQAREDFSLALQQSPDDSELAYMLATSYLQLGDIETALNTCLAFADSHPVANASILQCIGFTSYILGEYDLSLDYYDAAISTDSTIPSFYQQRASVRMVLEDYEGAVDDLNIALGFSLFASQPQLTWSLHQQLGIVHLLREDYSSAFSELTISEEQSQPQAGQQFELDFGGVEGLLGILALKQGNQEAAESYLNAWEQESNLMTNAVQQAMTRGLIQLIRGNTALASAQFDVALQLTTNPAYWSDLFVDLQILGRIFPERTEFFATYDTLAQEVLGSN